MQKHMAGEAICKLPGILDYDYAIVARQRWPDTWGSLRPRVLQRLDGRSMQWQHPPVT